MRNYPFVILLALLLSMFLPKYYNDIFGSRSDYVLIDYSPVDEKFIKLIVKSGKKREVVYTDLNESKKYSFLEYETKFPFDFYFDLISKNKFPKKFIAYGQEPQAIRRENSSLKLKPKDINPKKIELFSLLESKPKYSRLKMPEDLFRLSDDGITFIIASSNKIDTNKSKIYNLEFKKQNALFPLKKAFGNPTIRKPFDEGYFILDAKGQLFHLKRIEDKPKITKINTKGIRIKHMLISENARKEYYGLVIDESKNVYLLMYDDFEFVKLPIDKFDIKTDTLKLKTNPIIRSIKIEFTDNIKQQKVIKNFVTNLDYELIDKNEYRYSIKKGKLYELAESILFPFQIKLNQTKESHVSFEFTNKSFYAFIFSFILAILYLCYIRLSNKKIKKHIISFVLINLGGLYSLISLIVFDMAKRNEIE